MLTSIRLQDLFFINLFGYIYFQIAFRKDINMHRVRNENSRKRHGITSFPFGPHATSLWWNIDRPTKFFFVFKIVTLPLWLSSKQLGYRNGAIRTAAEISVLLLATAFQVSGYSSPHARHQRDRHTAGHWHMRLLGHGSFERHGAGSRPPATPELAEVIPEPFTEVLRSLLGEQTANFRFLVQPFVILFKKF